MYVYTVAFDTTGDFLLVHNVKRGGWEFPGGSVEDGESAEDAARREFLEETGFRIKLLGKRIWEDGGIVFSGTVTFRTREKVVDEAIDAMGMFSSLPEDIAWPREEYIDILQWARSTLSNNHQQSDE